MYDYGHMIPNWPVVDSELVSGFENIKNLEIPSENSIPYSGREEKKREDER